MKRTNGEGISDVGKGKLNGFGVLLGIVLLVVFLVGTLIAGVPNASAATADTVNITTGISMVENTSVVWISVEGGGQLMCIDNLCSDVYVPVEDDCPACPDCPDFNYTVLEGNLTGKMGDLEALVKSHNSSNLEDEDRTFIDTKVSEGASYSASQVWEYLNQTLMPSRRKLEDKDELIVSLKNSLREMNGTITMQGEQIRNYEENISELKFSRTIYAIFVAIFFGLVIIMYASKQGTLGDYKGRIKEGFGGLMPEETRVRKLQEIEEANEALEEEIKIDDALKRQEELKRSLTPQGQQMGEQMAGAGRVMDMGEGVGNVKGGDLPLGNGIPPQTFSPASVAVAAATTSGGVNLAKKRKERVTAIINYIEGKEEYAHNEAEILGWYVKTFGKSENTAKLEWGLARNMVEETYLGEMHFIGSPKEGLRFVKNG